jgi:hypothetical protein
MRHFTLKRPAVLVCVLALAAVFLSLALTQAQEMTGTLAAEQTPRIEKTLGIPAAQRRTWQAMEAANAEMAPMGLQPAAQETVPLLTPIGQAAYRALQEELAAAPGGARPVAAAPALGTTPPVQINFDGVNQITAGNWKPPDTHAAPGLNQVLEVTNLHVDVYSKVSPYTRVKSVSLGSFLAYAHPNNLTNPRVIYDSIWNRFVVTAINKPTTADPYSRVFLAVSTSSSPLGSWYIYQIAVGPNTTIWDYPMTGMDQDAIVVTGNVFAWNPSTGTGGAYQTSKMFAVAKARVYNGLGISFPIWYNFLFSPQPSVVLAPSAPSRYKNGIHLLAADPYYDRTRIFVYTLKDGACPYTQSVQVRYLTVPAFNFPPPAKQPGTTATLDTLDGRFVNYGTQFTYTDGTDRVFQVHTIQYPGTAFPSPKYYELAITPTSITLARSGWFYAATNSYDFNASLAANTSRDLFVTWTSTCPAANLNAQVRASGKLAANTAISTGYVLRQSVTSYKGSRWGDYSSVHLDPSLATGKRAWICNEYIRADGTWGSRLGRIGFN